MWAVFRIWLKVILGFFFSITAIMCAVIYGLLGARASDTVELIVTEATGLQQQYVLFAAHVQPLVLHNILWVGVAGLGFFLIFLYFIDHDFRVFLAPGVLCLVIAGFLNITLWGMASSITAYTGESAAAYALNGLERVRQAGFLLAALGFALIAASYWFGSNKQPPQAARSLPGR